jgi:hypothetical protein
MGACWTRAIAGTTLVVQYTFTPPVVCILAVLAAG